MKEQAKKEKRRKKEGREGRREGVGHTSDPSTWEAEAGGSSVLCQPGLRMLRPIGLMTCVT